MPNAAAPPLRSRYGASHGYPWHFRARALKTRQAILDALDDALVTTPWADLTVKAVMRETQWSPATFYQYFPDLTAAVRELAALIVERGDVPSAHVRAIVSLLDIEAEAAR